MIAQQEVREAHAAFAVGHRRVVVIDAVGEFRGRPEVTVADVEMTEPLHVHVVIDAVVAGFAVLELSR